MALFAVASKPQIHHLRTRSAKNSYCASDSKLRLQRGLVVLYSRFAA